MADIVNSHTQSETDRLVFYYPDHEPREDDPHYSLFNATRARLVKLGSLKCWRCGATEKIELHHSEIEFSLQNGVDPAKFEAAHPEFRITSDDEFQAWVEGEGNLLPLCMECHRGTVGIHHVPYPCWLIGRYWKTGLPAAVSVQGGK